ncbi:MAG: hypothetical protein IMF14_04800 [Proteobacteria bacterium]|nr:hypothetical protein [Pseudomonadota bacterium]
MKIKYLLTASFGFGLTFYVAATSANADFQQWMQQQSQGVAAQKKEFQDYRDKRDKEFTVFLKAHWTAIDLLKGKVRDEAPKPDIMPVASPELPEPMSSKPDEPPVVVVVPEPEPVQQEPVQPGAAKKPVPLPSAAVPEGKRLDINFYGKQLRFYYDARLDQRLIRQIDKNAVSDYWSALSRSDYDGLLEQLAAEKNALQLNDWAYASLVNTLALAINHHKKNEAALLSWFLLAKSGYKARIAYDDASIYLLVPSRQEMFEVSYFTFSGTRYYAISFDGKKQRFGRVFTYDSEYPGASKEFDMRVTPVVASNGKSERRHLSFEFERKKYNVDVSYDRGRVKFFDSYPQLDLDLYFGSGVYKVTATPLQKQLAAYMKGMSEQQAVNFLLRFVQTALKYETDEQQFGEENYLFPEETLFYPYSDCEDRAILFSWLVQSLLKLDVVGLDYPGHIATAVNLHSRAAGDSITYKGKHYVVADPTYINATIGMTMPDLKQYQPEVIAY